MNNWTQVSSIYDTVVLKYQKHFSGKGISVHFGDGVMVQFNYVHANKGEGITVDQPYPVVVRDNSVTCNAGSGVNVSSQGKVGLIFMIFLEFFCAHIYKLTVLTIMSVVATTADSILKYTSSFFNFSKKIRLSISHEFSAKQTMHIQCQSIFL